MAGFFYEIIGHKQIIDYFKNAILMNKISHAYILNGPEKSGKRLLANSLAMTLQCQQKKAEPCLTCRSCKQVLSKNHPDIIYLQHEKPNTITVDDIRKQINHDISIKPYSSPYKIYIIYEAEKMNSQAQNALLKTIEEAPRYAIIMLLTTNRDTFLPTISSRCVILNLKAVPDDVIKEHLMKEYQLPDYKADICTAFAQGNVGKAILLAENEDFNEIKDLALQLLKRIKVIDLHEMIEAVKQISNYKLQFNDYFDIMLIWYRDVLLYKATNDIDALIFKEEVYDIKKQASKCSYHGIEIIIKSLEKAKQRLNANVNFELVIELLLFTIKENG